VRTFHEALEAVETYSPAEEQFNNRRRTIGLFLGPLLLVALIALPLPVPLAAHKLVAHPKEDRGWATEKGKRPDRERDIRSCGVVYRTDKDPVADAQLAKANKVFDILEAACPRVFSPTPFASEHNVGVWQRHYLNTEAQLTVSIFDGVNFSHFRMFRGANFGSIDDVLNHKVPIQCPQIEYQTPQ